MGDKNGIKGIESISIDFVPLDKRYGHPRSQFFLWFGSTTVVLTTATGAFAPSLGLNLAWSIVAIIVGLLLGGLFMAFHSAQGPHLGIPQMIQSRAQFGVVGAVVPLVLVIVLFLGFFSSTTYYTAQTLTPLNLSMPAAIIIAGIIALVISIYGYEAIHKAEKFCSILTTIVFLIITIAALQLPLPEGSLTFGPVNIGNFLLAVSVYVTFLVTAAPYVADYSRYLPETTSVASTFWYTYLGATCGAGWMCILGAIMYIAVPNYATNSAVALADLWSLPFPIIAYAAMLIAAASSATLSLYGTFMAIVTVFSSFTKLKGSKKAKIIIMVATTTVAVCIDIFGAENMIVQWGNFMAIILYFMIPWTSINLVDFYLVRKGKYSMKDIFDPNGIYGRVNKKAMVTYFATIIIQLPFINAAWYTGAIAKAMDGADIAWLVGGAFSAILYYMVNRDLAKKSREE